MSLCKECNNNVFGGGYCKYHQYRRGMQGGDKYTRKPKIKKRKPIPKESKKRKEEHKYYSQHCRELTQELKDANDGRIFCFFSGREITGRPVYHHLRGRSGDFYTDKRWLVPCLNKYHNMYHFTPTGKLREESWYPEFLIKLREKADDLYEKEIKKQSKSELNFE